MVLDIYTLIEAFWFIIPAYAANGLTPLARGRKPLDGGRTLLGEPIFGAGKTWRGTLFGILVGALIGTVHMFAYPYIPFYQAPRHLVLITMGPLIGALLGFGALMGDLGGSFIKRRLKISRGQPAFLLDQLDFIIGAILVAMFVFVLPWEAAVLLFIITPALHLFSNFIAFKLKVKNTPW